MLCLTPIHRSARPNRPAKGVATLWNKPLAGTSGFHDCQTYLDYCRDNRVSVETSNFGGTLYELYSKQVLESVLGCKGLVRTGGAYDNGLDLYGKWNLRPYHDYATAPSIRPQKAPARSLIKRSVEGGAGKSGVSLENDILVLVQCKNVSRRITASLIRELAGIYNFHVKKRTGQHSVLTSYMVLVSPTTLTAQAINQMNTSDFPILHLILPALSYAPCSSSTALPRDGLFDVANWTSPGLQSVYLNPKARTLLAGLNMELQLRMILKERQAAAT